MNDTPLSRRIFWWTLFVLFWMTSTSIIAYAFGYRFSFERGIFVYAGSVTLKTTPQNVDVYINNVLYPSKQLNRINSSYHIGGITPGDYNLEVRAQGYATWSKKITVHSGISTEFWNIVLAKDSYQQKQYDASGVGRFFISPRKNLVAVAQQNDASFSVKVVSDADNTVDEIFSTTEYSFTNDAKENIEWTPQAHRVIIPTIKNDTQEKNYFIVDVSTRETLNLKDITGTSDFSHVRWDPKTKNALFYVSEGNLFRIDLDSPTEIKQIATNIASYELASQSLYFFQLPEGIVYKTNFDGTDTPEQITLSSPSHMEDPTYQIIAYDDDRLTLINNSHDLYVFNKGDRDDYFEQLSDNAIGSQFSDDGKKLLFWSDHEVAAYFVRDWDVQPIRKENDDIPITRYIDSIQNVQWSRDYEHVLLTVDRKLKLIEIDQRDHKNIMDIISLNSDNADIVNNNSDGLIYLTDTNDQGNATLRSIEFPEKITLLQTFFPGNGNTTNQTSQQQ